MVEEKYLADLLASYWFFVSLLDEAKRILELSTTNFDKLFDERKSIGEGPISDK